MTISAKIRRYLAKGTSIAEIAKRLGVSKNNVWTVIWKEKQKAKQKNTQVERSHDPKVVEAEKKYIKEAEALYKKFGAKPKPGRPKKVVEQKWVELTYPGEALIPGSVPLPADLVNHPEHYKAGGIETIDFIESKDLNYRLGNVVKYISRAGKKDSDPVQDLEKAAWYLKREIDARKRA